MSENWKPIESAPKDGSEVLAWGLVRGCDIKIVAITYWSNPMPGLARPAWRMMQDTMNQEFLAECWMPLPSPPA